MALNFHSVMNRGKVLVTGILICAMAAGSFVVPSARAADGSGTATVSPGIVNAGSTGNTLTFTYAAAEAMSSGGITVTVPSGWTLPQGTASGAAVSGFQSANGIDAFGYVGPATREALNHYAR